MNLKIEIVITVWEDNLFKLRDKIEGNNTESIREQFELTMNNIEDRLIKKKPPLEIDDDIPF